ncbi:hypothetical protein D3C72_1471700 [compost metagenome]
MPVPSLARLPPPDSDCATVKVLPASAMSNPPPAVPRLMLRAVLWKPVPVTRSVPPWKSSAARGVPRLASLDTDSVPALRRVAWVWTFAPVSTSVPSPVLLMPAPVSTLSMVAVHDAEARLPSPTRTSPSKPGVVPATSSGSPVRW